MPRRFGLTYIGPDNQPHTPVMIHRAILGSFERFIGILLEHTAGELPLWLAPTQVKILPISDKLLPYAESVYEKAYQAGLRVELDCFNEKLNKKILLAEQAKIPLLWIVGAKEAENQTVSIRDRRERTQRSDIPVSQAIQEALSAAAPPN